MAKKIYMVEIGIKDWIADLPVIGGRTVCYEEVLAEDEITARYAGFDQFEVKVRYEPVTRLLMKRLGLAVSDCCAPAAIEI